MGRDNPLTDTLTKIGRVRPGDLAAGQGLVQVVPRAFGNQTATVVTGGNAAGTEAAARYLAERVPYVWDTRRGSLTFQDVSTEMTRFLQARTGAGQASLMLAELDNALEGITATGIQSAEVTMFLEAGNPEVEAFVGARVREKLKIQNVTVKSRGMTNPETVFDDTMQVPWEVDDLRERLKTEVMPKVTAGARVDIEARVSEAPEFRRQLADEIRAQVRAAGAQDANVQRALGVQAGVLVAGRRGHPVAQGARCQPRAHRGRAARRRPVEGAEVLRGADAVDPRAVSGRRDLRARTGPGRRRVQHRAGRHARARPTGSRRSTSAGSR